MSGTGVAAAAATAAEGPTHGDGDGVGGVDDVNGRSATKKEGIKTVFFAPTLSTSSDKYVQLSLHALSINKVCFLNIYYNIFTLTQNQAST